ncbi:hypothetical protein HKBW3C_01883 [Candidatus Hakubella thermalkaliphila]|nr:hypothetical protein HKBW3C_01883 [Candidatus Hakubella thermalkaliphila]
MDDLNALKRSNKVIFHSLKSAHLIYGKELEELIRQNAEDTENHQDKFRFRKALHAESPKPGKRLGTGGTRHPASSTPGECQTFSYPQ